VALVGHNGKPDNAYFIAVVADNGVAGEHHDLGTQLQIGKVQFYLTCWLTRSHIPHNERSWGKTKLNKFYIKLSSRVDLPILLVTKSDGVSINKLE